MVAIEIAKQRFRLADRLVKAVYDLFFPGLLRGSFIVTNSGDSDYLLVSSLNGSLQEETLNPSQLLARMKAANPEVLLSLDRDDILISILTQDFGKNPIKGHLILSEAKETVAYFITTFESELWDFCPRVNLSSTKPSFEVHFPSYIYFILANRFLKDFFSSNEDLGGNANLLSEREILEHASDWFLSDIVSEITGNKLNFILKTISSISKRNYETKPSIGTLIFGRDEDLDATFLDEVALNNHKKARKLLELTDSGRALFSNGVSYTGILNYKPQTISPKQRMVIEFQGHQKWRVFLPSKRSESQIFMTFTDGIPSFQEYPKGENTLLTCLQKAFPNTSIEKHLNLVHLFMEFRRSGKPGVLIFDKHADEESERLKSRGIRIIPILADSVNLSSFANVDGAILINLDGMICAFGVILDGIQTKDPADSSRGSRFNSTKTYISCRSHLAVGAVFSVDGDVDIIT